MVGGGGGEEEAEEMSRLSGSEWNLKQSSTSGDCTTHIEILQCLCFNILQEST